MFAPISHFFAESFPDRFNVTEIPEYGVNKCPIIFGKLASFDDNLAYLYKWEEIYGGDAVCEAMAKMLTRGGGNGSPLELTELLFEAMSVANSIELLSEEHRDMIGKGLLAVKKEPEAFLRYLDTAHPDATRRLVYYYLHRYFLDSALGLDGFGTYTRLSLSLSLITESAAFARKNHVLADFIDIARELSKSLEYSTENVDILLDTVAFD